jgi:hypothetical protein
MDDFDEEVDWAALKRLNDGVEMDKRLNQDLSAEDLAEKILTDAAPVAAHSIVKIATMDPSSAVRLRASQYILDRAIGKTGDGPTKNAPWDEIFKQTAVPMER